MYYLILCMVQVLDKHRHLGCTELGTALYLLFLQLVNLVAGVRDACQEQLPTGDVIYHSWGTASRCSLGNMQQLHLGPGRQTAHHFCQSVQHRSSRCLRTLQPTNSSTISLLFM